MEQVSSSRTAVSLKRTQPTLEQQRESFKQNRFIAMPLAGTIVWAILGASAPFVSELTITWMLYIGTGAIFYLGAGLSYLTGERFFAKKATSNSFDRLFRWHANEPFGVCHRTSGCGDRPYNGFS